MEKKTKRKFAVIVKIGNEQTIKNFVYNYHNQMKIPTKNYKFIYFFNFYYNYSQSLLLEY